MNGLIWFRSKYRWNRSCRSNGWNHNPLCNAHNWQAACNI